MTTAAHDVDGNVTAVVRILMAYSRERQADVCAATSIPLRTFIRRMKDGVGGWAASEIAALASHYDVPVSAFYDGPDALLRTSRFFREAVAA